VSHWRLKSAKRVFKLLTKNKVITDFDLAMLATFCQMWGDYISSIKTNEPVTMAHITQMRLLAGEFGLTPVSRSRVEMIEPVSSEPDPWDEF